MIVRNGYQAAISFAKSQAPPFATIRSTVSRARSVIFVFERTHAFGAEPIGGQRAIGLVIGVIHRDEIAREIAAAGLFLEHLLIVARDQKLPGAR
jgi:hypothetical protein